MNQSLAPTPPPPDQRDERRWTSVAFLLAQLGNHGATRYAERLAELSLSPPQAGLLRQMVLNPGSNQQQLASRLGLLPSRVVTFVDGLEQQGLVRRVRSATDRRQYELQLTASGRSLFERLQIASQQHDAEITKALSEEEHRTLAGLLQRIADDQGLISGVHPGYRQLSNRPANEPGGAKPDRSGAS
ncbi:MAG: MarR family winged helix-turn-helix transcriptional regulator [Actinomycetota bacterium]|nr:MarR family winged helix-turn-helix transcriptional regulator [Actinomycetota bacterium]